MDGWVQSPALLVADTPQLASVEGLRHDGMMDGT
jgi:hypothetical protein